MAVLGRVQTVAALRRTVVIRLSFAFPPAGGVAIGDAGLVLNVGVPCGIAELAVLGRRLVMRGRSCDISPVVDDAGDMGAILPADRLIDVDRFGRFALSTSWEAGSAAPPPIASPAGTREIGGPAGRAATKSLASVSFPAASSWI